MSSRNLANGPSPHPVGAVSTASLTREPSHSRSKLGVPNPSHRGSVSFGNLANGPALTLWERSRPRVTPANRFSRSKLGVPGPSHRGSVSSRNLANGPAPHAVGAVSTASFTPTEPFTVRARRPRPLPRRICVIRKPCKRPGASPCGSGLDREFHLRTEPFTVKARRPRPLPRRICVIQKPCKRPGAHPVGAVSTASFTCEPNHSRSKLAVPAPSHGGSVSSRNLANGPALTLWERSRPRVAPANRAIHGQS